MFKSIYNVHFAGLQYSVLKIIPSMSKNRVRQSYLILNYCGLSEFVSQYAGNIHGGCGAAGRMRGGGAGGAQDGAYFAICELM